MFRLIRTTRPFFNTRCLSQSSKKNIEIITKQELQQVFSSSAKNVIVIDVRQPEEIQQTGALSPTTINVPLPNLLSGALKLPSEEWKDQFGHEKPKPSDKIIFSCLAGIRSANACRAAIEQGYPNVVNYLGGSSEFLSK